MYIGLYNLCTAPAILCTIRVILWYSSRLSVYNYGKVCVHSLPAFFPYAYVIHCFLISYNLHNTLYISRYDAFIITCLKNSKLEHHIATYTKTTSFYCAYTTNDMKSRFQHQLGRRPTGKCNICWCCQSTLWLRGLFCR